MLKMLGETEQIRACPALGLTCFCGGEPFGTLGIGGMPEFALQQFRVGLPNRILLSGRIILRTERRGKNFRDPPRDPCRRAALCAIIEKI